jgi:hypothetical protein
MKRSAIILALAITGLSACNQSDDIRSFIPGMYVKSSASEFSKANDTLRITLISANAFGIIHDTGYQLIRNGSLSTQKHKQEKLTGIYDPQKKILQETSKGLLFIFNPEKQVLLINSAEYRKIN